MDASAVFCSGPGGVWLGCSPGRGESQERTLEELGGTGLGRPCSQAPFVLLGRVFGRGGQSLLA